MPLDAADLLDIETLLSEADDSFHLFARVRQRFPTLTVTRCDPSDVDLETPIRATPRFSVYLVDGVDHCWRLTTDVARATGLVLVST
jgi:hypothetical protein